MEEKRKAFGGPLTDMIFQEKANYEGNVKEVEGLEMNDINPKEED